jgi:hypothetical protein
MSSAKISDRGAPSFITKRLHDKYLATGSTIVLMGTDRLSPDGPAGVGAGIGHIEAEGRGVGTWSTYIISGISDKDSNPDAKADRAYIHVCQKTEADKNCGTEFGPSKADKVSAVIARADAVRLVARSAPPSGQGSFMAAMDDGQSYFYFDKERIDLVRGGSSAKIEDKKVSVVTEESLTTASKKFVVDSPVIELGKAPPPLEKVIKGDTYTNAENTFLSALAAYITALSTALPPTASPGATLNTAIATFQAALPTSLSQKVKVG